MARVHVVKQGETLSSIAEQYDFLGHEGIWNAPENAGLRAARQSGHVLHPGDEVVIPDQVLKSVDCAVDQEYQFQVYVERTQLILHLQDSLGKPPTMTRSSIMSSELRRDVEARGADERDLLAVVLRCVLRLGVSRRLDQQPPP